MKAGVLVDAGWVSGGVGSVELLELIDCGCRTDGEGGGEGLGLFPPMPFLELVQALELFLFDQSKFSRDESVYPPGF
jgi:hypothetical protein